VLAAPALLYLIVLFLVPVAQFLTLAVHGPRGMTLQYWQKLAATPVYLRVILTTFQVSALVAVICVVAGYPVAYVLAHLKERGRNAWLILVLLPFWTSFLVRTFAWITLLGNTGFFNRVLSALHLPHLPLMYNLTGVLIGMVHALLPFAILTMLGVMQSIDRRLRPAAELLGAPPSVSFWRIFFPLSLPGVAAAALLVFITSLSFFITPAFLGGPKQLLIAQAIQTKINEQLDWGFAAVLSVVLLVTTLLVFALYAKLLGLENLYGTPAGSSATGDIAGRRNGLARWTAPIFDGLERVLLWADRHFGARSSRARGGRVRTWIGFGLVLAFLVFPILIVFPIAFSSSSFVEFPPKLFSLQWYHDFFADPVWLDATLRSTIVALAVAVLSLLLGGPAAFAIARRDLPGKTWIQGLVLSPMIVPRMVTAVALYFLFAHVGLAGTTFGLILAHTIIAVPYVVITLTAVLANFDWRFVDAASVMGASPLRTLRFITLPLIRTGLVSAGLFAFITSFDELTFALFIAGGVHTTLPRKMWDSMFLQVSPTLAAVSSLLVALATLGLIAAELVRGRTKSDTIVPEES